MQLATLGLPSVVPPRGLLADLALRDLRRRGIRDPWLDRRIERRLAPAHVQSPGTRTTANTNTSAVTITAATTGNLLVAVCIEDTAARTLSSVTDGTNTYTIVATSTSLRGTARVYIAYAFNVSGSPTSVTATWSGTSTSKIIWVIEVSGIQTTDPIDQSSKKDNAASATAMTGTTTGTTTVADEIVIGGFLCQANFTAAGAGYTAFVGGALNGNCPVYRIVSATGTQQVLGTQDASATFAAATATFKGATGGASLSYPRLERSIRGALRGMPGRV